MHIPTISEQSEASAPRPTRASRATTPPRTRATARPKPARVKPPRGTYERQLWCPKCSATVTASRLAPHHWLHLILSILTLGGWIIFWGLTALHWRFVGYRCTTCRSRCGRSTPVALRILAYASALLGVLFLGAIGVGIRDSLCNRHDDYSAAPQHRLPTAHRAAPIPTGSSTQANQTNTPRIARERPTAAQPRDYHSPGPPGPYTPPPFSNSVRFALTGALYNHRDAIELNACRDFIAWINRQSIADRNAIYANADAANRAIFRYRRDPTRHPPTTPLRTYTTRSGHRIIARYWFRRGTYAVLYVPGQGEAVIPHQNLVAGAAER